MPPQEINALVPRDALGELLCKIDGAIEKARLKNGVVAFWGD